MSKIVVRVISDSDSPYSHVPFTDFLPLTLPLDTRTLSFSWTDSTVSRQGRPRVSGKRER